MHGVTLLYKVVAKVMGGILGHAILIIPEDLSRVAGPSHHSIVRFFKYKILLPKNRSDLTSSFLICIPFVSLAFLLNYL